MKQEGGLRVQSEEVRTRGYCLFVFKVIREVFLSWCLFSRAGVRAGPYNYLKSLKTE